MKKLTVFTLSIAVLLSACSRGAWAPSEVGASTPIAITAEVSTAIVSGPGTTQPFPTPAPPTPLPTLAGGLSVTELKYKVLDQFPDFFFCDPDFYPVARDDEMSMARQNFPELQANQEEFQVILSHLGLGGQTTFTDEQKLQIYRDHKKLNAIFFQLVDDNRYRFQIQTGAEGQQGEVVTGTIEGSGSIEVSQREPGFPNCPICLAAGTLIDTPRGAVRVEELKMGDLVWTEDESGRRVIGSVVRTGHVSVPASHQMVHVSLSDGRELWASPGHPTADGRTLGELRAGDTLDGARIVQVEILPYGQAFTYDILPSGTTGFYWANGILMGSTLSAP
ncbi:MAG: Hint domain-containing protein [Bacteroidota bacterium]